MAGNYVACLINYIVDNVRLRQQYLHIKSLTFLAHTHTHSHSHMQLPHEDISRCIAGGRKVYQGIARQGKVIACLR